MTGRVRGNALDREIIMVFENRSLANLLGRLHGPGDGKIFDGVLGKDLISPIPEWADHGAGRKVAPYAVATDMNSPSPDTGEEYPRTGTQPFNILCTSSITSSRSNSRYCTRPHRVPSKPEPEPEPV